jgi:hypothetical protein
MCTVDGFRTPSCTRGPDSHCTHGALFRNPLGARGLGSRCCTSRWIYQNSCCTRGLARCFNTCRREYGLLSVPEDQIDSAVPVDGSTRLLPVPEDKVDSVVASGGDVARELDGSALHTSHHCRKINYCNKCISFLVQDP